MFLLSTKEYLNNVNKKSRVADTCDERYMIDPHKSFVKFTPTIKYSEHDKLQFYSELVREYYDSVKGDEEFYVFTKAYPDFFVDDNLISTLPFDIAEKYSYKKSFFLLLKNKESNYQTLKNIVNKEVSFPREILTNRKQFTLDIDSFIPGSICEECDIELYSTKGTFDGKTFSVDFDQTPDNQIEVSYLVFDPSGIPLKIDSFVIRYRDSYQPDNSEVAETQEVTNEDAIEHSTYIPNDIWIYPRIYLSKNSFLRLSQYINLKSSKTISVEWEEGVAKSLFSPYASIPVSYKESKYNISLLFSSDYNQPSSKHDIEIIPVNPLPDPKHVNILIISAFPFFQNEFWINLVKNSNSNNLNLSVINNPANNYPMWGYRGLSIEQLNKHFTVKPDSTLPDFSLFSKEQKDSIDYVLLLLGSSDFKYTSEFAFSESLLEDDIIGNIESICSIINRDLPKAKIGLSIPPPIDLSDKSWTKEGRTDGTSYPRKVRSHYVRYRNALVKKYENSSNPYLIPCDLGIPLDCIDFTSSYNTFCFYNKLSLNSLAENISSWLLYVESNSAQ